jgi:glutaredoxin
MAEAFLGIGGGVDGMASRIKIFSTPGCGLCDQAKKYFAGKGVEVDLVDVSGDNEALLEMRKLSGGVRTAPVISICDKVFVGFNKKELEEAASCL